MSASTVARKQRQQHVTKKSNFEIVPIQNSNLLIPTNFKSVKKKFLSRREFQQKVPQQSQLNDSLIEILVQPT